MIKDPSKIKKLYYSIGEVSKITELKQYVLRYWETEFKELSPSKNKAGNRTYRQKDIDLINKIKDLLYNQKFTIDGARNMLSNDSHQETEDGKYIHAIEYGCCGGYGTDCIHEEVANSPEEYENLYKLVYEEPTVPGRFIVFPPTIMHRSTPNKENCDRITLAANWFPTGLVNSGGVSHLKVKVMQ